MVNIRTSVMIRASTIGYYFTASYRLLALRGTWGTDILVGAGLGRNDIRARYDGSDAILYSNSYGDGTAILQQDRRDFGMLAFIAAEMWYDDHWTVSLDIAYRYIPIQSLDAVEYVADVVKDHSTSPPTVRTLVARLPAMRISFSNVLYGMSIGFHF